MGKWFNFIERFYRVANLREKNERYFCDTIKTCKNQINIYTDSSKENTDKFSIIRKDGLEYLNTLLNENMDTLKVRTLAAELIVNISTLKRHALLFPNTVPLIIECICDSYNKLREEIQ